MQLCCFFTSSKLASMTFGAPALASWTQTGFDGPIGEEKKTKWTKGTKVLTIVWLMLIDVDSTIQDCFEFRFEFGLVRICTSMQRASSSHALKPGVLKTLWKHPFKDFKERKHSNVRSLRLFFRSSSSLRFRSSSASLRFLFASSSAFLRWRKSRCSLKDLNPRTRPIPEDRGVGRALGIVIVPIRVYSTRSVWKVHIVRQSWPPFLFHMSTSPHNNWFERL